MKTLENKPFTDTVKALNAEGKIELIKIEGNYSDLLKEALDHVGEAGIKPSEMRQRMKVLDKLSTVNMQEIELEDSEFKVLIDCWNQISWKRMSLPIIELDDYLSKIN